MLVRSVALATIVLGLLGCTRPDVSVSEVSPAGSSDRLAEGPASVKGPARLAEAKAMYRLDFTLVMTDQGKPPVNSEYTLTLEENTRGEVRQGRNVPAPSASPSASARPMGVARQDVGFLLRCTYSVNGDNLVVHSDTEMSDIDDRGSVHKLSLKGDALLAPGKVAVVAISEDPITHRRYELKASASKLR